MTARMSKGQIAQPPGSPVRVVGLDKLQESFDRVVGGGPVRAAEQKISAGQES